MARKKGSYGSSQNSIQNAAKTLKANIQFASVDSPIQSVLLTSSVPDEGKSTIAVNLAQSFAQAGKKVILVECDLRRRSIAHMLGVHTKGGLYAVLSGQASLEEMVVPLSQSNMFFLDCEPNIPNPADILNSKRFAKLVGNLEDHYDYVIFDTPPVGAFIDAAVLSQLVDGVLFVVRRDFAKREQIASAFDQLKKAGANVLGTVLNYAESSSDGYYYSNYYGGSKDTGNVQGSTVHVHGENNRRAPINGASRTAAGKRFSK